MVNRQPQDAERVYASGLYLSGNDQTIWLWRKSPLCRAAWTDNIRELEARLQSDRVLRQPTSCATAATKRRRSPSSNGSPPRCAMI